MNIARKLLILTFALLIIGCRATYIDISDEPDYLSYIGQRYQLKSDMDLSGVNAPPGYSDEIHYYVISSRDPGWSGPEVITRETLTAGTTFVILQVEECTNCLTFGEKLQHMIVKIEGIQVDNGQPIYVYVHEIYSGKHLNKVK